MQISILLTAQVFPVYSQTENDSDKHENSFVVTASSSYHFSPWKQFNKAFERFDEVLRFSPYFIQPHGTIETVKGDITFELALTYRIFEDVRLRATLSQIRTEATTNVYFATAVFGDYTLHHLDERMGLKVNTLGIGADYTFHLGNAFQLRLFTIGQLALGAFSFDHRYSEYERNYEYLVLHTAELSQNVLGSNSGASLVYHLSKTFAISFSAEYRYFVFNYLQGPATASTTHGDQTDKRNYTARLLYEHGYFGITGENGYSIDQPWQSITSYDDIEGGIIDLRSFGLKLGIEIGL